ncbi:MAG: hypothetical protein CML31_14740 [Rhizobiales bacterium]|nr:hypothetical protein [Hyphomicrobiales bacterium]|tara:strand:- start:9789 stop:10094 length:306 start_codon:yes stop_codon:yes gene_type:complete
MAETSAEDRINVNLRILHAKADAALRLAEKVSEFVQMAGIPIENFQSMARSIVNGRGGDPAFVFALADYTHEPNDAATVRKRAEKLMFDDLDRKKEISVAT